MVGGEEGAMTVSLIRVGSVGEEEGKEEELERNGGELGRSLE